MGWGDASPKARACFFCFLTVGFIIGIFLLAFSWRVVNYDEWGLRYNQQSREIKSDQAYPPGRHFVGLGNNFHRFNKSYQTIEFSALAVKDHGDRGPIHIRTKETFTNIVELSFQYILMKDSLRLLFEKYKFDYERWFVRDAIGVFHEIGSEFKSQDWVSENRGKVEARMRQGLAEKLKLKYATLTGLQLLTVQLSPNVDNLLLKGQLDEQRSHLLVVKNHMKVVQTTTEKILTIRQGNVSSELAEFREETKQQALEVELLSDTERKRSETSVREIDADTEKELVAYRTHTENLKKLIDRNATIAVKRTEELVANMEATLAYERAQHEADVQAINAAKEAEVTRINAGLAAELESARKGLNKQYLGELAQELGLDPTQLVQYEWLTRLAAMPEAQMYLDFKKPNYYVKP